MTNNLTMTEARAALDAVPAHLRNNNCVQDAAWRLRDALNLAGEQTGDAPSYVVKAVNDLASWLDHVLGPTTTNLTSLEVSKLTAVMTGGGYKRSSSKDAAVARFLKTAEEVGMNDAAKLLGDEYGFDTAHHVLVERKKGGYASIPEALADASLTPAEDDEGAALAERYQAEVEAFLQPGEETNEGEIGRWKQTDDGPVWQARRPVAAHTGTLVGRVSVEDVMNGRLFGGKTKKIAAVKGEPDAAAAKEPKAESKAAMLLRLAQTPEGVTNTAMKELTGWAKLGGFFNAAKKAGLELTRVRENGDTTWRAAPAAGE